VRNEVFFSLVIAPRDDSICGEWTVVIARNTAVS
jgi:hypothetical protein